MTRTLAIDTASPAVGVAAVEAGDGAGVTVAAAETGARADPAHPGLAAAVAAVLDRAGWKPADVERVVVNAGPGYLSAVRSGVAYANALGWSLGVPVQGVDALDLLAAEAATPGTAVLALRHAGAGQVFAACYPVDGSARRLLGPVADAVRLLAADLPAVAVAGSLHDQIAAALPGVAVRDSGVEFSGVLTLAAAPHVGAPAGPVSPTTERSPRYAEEPQ